jgi:arylsulfatase A-like enzyme
LHTKLQQRLSRTPPDWRGLFLLTFILAQLYALSEWVFTVTRPSYLDVFSWFDKLEVLLFGGALVAALSLVGLGAAVLVGRLVGLRRLPRLFYWLASLLPAGLLAVLLLLLVDNFTYTLFSFGIATTNGAWRGLYAALFIALLGWSDWEVLDAARWLNRRLGSDKPRPRLWVGLGVWMVLWLVLPLAADGGDGKALDTAGAELSRHPHILWITVDGLSATNLSLYGYVRDTTPNLRALAESALVADNAFANADKTAGSLVSMLSGQHPLRTRVMYMPDILVGAESYQHLPGILRAEGYYTVQYGFPYYVDAYKINMLDSFDMANGRTIATNPVQAALQENLPGELAYFIYETANRADNRLRHIFFIQVMPNPRDTVVAPARNQTDDEKVETLLTSLDEFDQPMFIHLHLLEAHGPVYSPEKKVFSRGLAFDDQGEWNRNFYDDAILEVDADIGRVAAALEEHGLLEDTLLIIGSDHAMGFEQRQRVPLLMRFPGAEISGRVVENVQGLDIAPTILDYLGLPQPAWMSGQSLLDETFEKRYIFGAGVGPLAQNENRIWVIDPQRSMPPFYQFGTVNVIDCNVWYELDLADQSLSSGEVSGHTAPCPVEEIITPTQAFELMVGYLRENGFEVGELEGMER